MPMANGLRAQCAAHKIDAKQLRVYPTAPTSYTDVMTVQDTGRRTFFHQRGANAFLDDAHFDFASAQAKIFHLGYLLLLDHMDQPVDAEFGTIAARTLHRASEAGLKTSIDVVSEDSQRFAQVVLPALRHVDYCLLNEFELERTADGAHRVRGAKGIDFTALPELPRCKSCIAAGVHRREWVIVHFAEGACASGGTGSFARREAFAFRRRRLSARSVRAMRLPRAFCSHCMRNCRLSQRCGMASVWPPRACGEPGRRMGFGHWRNALRLGSSSRRGVVV